MTQPKIDTLDRVRELIEEITGTPADQVQPELRLVEDLEIDSLSKVEMAVATQEEFKLDIPDSEMFTLRTVQDVVDLIHRLDARV